MSRIVSALLACACTAALLACVPGGPLNRTNEPPAPVLSPASSARAEPVRSTAEIAGEWDVVRFDAYEPARLAGTKRAAFVDFDARGVSLQIECNRSGGPGRVVDGEFRTLPGDWVQTTVGCGAEREARDAAFFAFFRNQPSVGKLGEGRLVLRSAESELVLERPSTRRLAFLPTADALAGEWRLAEITRFVPDGGIYGIGLSDIPGRVILSGERGGYSRCPQYDLSIELTADGMLRKTRGAPLPTGPIGCRELADTNPPTPGMPTPWDAMRVLHGDPLVERSGRDAILLTSGDFRLLLTRESCGLLGAAMGPPR